jgi:hypothetical protein
MNPDRMIRNSPKGLAFLAVFMSCFGGISIGMGVQQLNLARERFEWIHEVLSGAAWLLIGIFWAVMLARRAESAKPQAPTQQA